MKLKNFVKRLKNFYFDSNRKKALLILQEVVQLFIKTKSFPFHYFIKFLYRQEIAEIDNFLDLKQERKIMSKSRRYTPIIVDRVASNKLLFHLYLNKTKVTAPKLIGWNLRDSFYSNSERDEYQYLSESEFHQLLTDSIKEGENVFYKPVTGMGGIGCGRISAENVVDFDLNTISQGDYIFEREIKQHQSVDHIYSKSLNTIRFITYFDQKNKDLVFLASLMRFGVNNQSVDNASYGGVFVPVNTGTGQLLKYGYSHMHYGGIKRECHPDSGIRFNNFQIPYFNEILTMVRENIKYYPGVLLGWDVGISPHGPVLVELNSLPGLMGADISYGGLKSHPEFYKIEDYLKGSYR